MLGVFHELGGVGTAIGIVGRAGDPALQVLRLGDLGGIVAAADGVVDALAGGAERRRHVQLRIRRQRRGLGVGVHAEHADLADHLVDREGAARRLGIEDDLALVVVDQVARHLGGFLRRALGIAHHQLDLAAVDAARLVERVEHRAHAANAGLADQGDTARLDGRHADLDGAALACDDRRHADDARSRRGAGGLQHATTAD